MVDDRCGALCEFAAMIVLLGRLFLDSREPPPTDEEMIASFNRNRTHLEMLREKLCSLPHAQTVMMDPEWSKPEVGEVEKQWYYSIFKVIEARGVQAVPNPCRVWIAIWGEGFGDVGDYKDYRYGPPLHEETIDLENLDAVDQTSQEVGFFQRKLEDGWWLEFDHWP
jgi:hypothetical protein